MSEASGERAVYPSLEGKRILVTGGGSGIGAGLVDGFTSQGCDVALIDINGSEADELAQRSGLRFVRADLTDIKATRIAITQVIDASGAIDLLVNNAANDDRHAIEDVTGAYWDDRLNVNPRHQFFCTLALVPRMRAKGGGVIINLGSISWHLALPGLGLYETRKAAIEGLTRAFARELGPNNIPVSCVVPDNVRTDRQLKWYMPEGEAEIVNAQCLKRRLVPEDIAAMTLVLASDDARLITGHEYCVDAGWGLR